MKILVLTGAGISAESGLPTFRDSGGLWHGHRPEDLATPEAFARNPALVLDFYNARRQAVQAAEPNAAHVALARLQASGRHKVIIVTQNVDDLHERAGARRVVHMHGSILRACCTACGAAWAASYAMDAEDPCPDCGEPAVRPDVVWFGESPRDLNLIHKAIEKADLFVSIGTSGSVYPAAGFAARASCRGVRTIEINKALSLNSSEFQERREGNATDLVPAWVDELR